MATAGAAYADRQGYDPAFLGGGAARCVWPPALGRRVRAAAAPLLEPRPGNTHVLHYHHYSVVMHAARRLALYSAANVDFAGRFALPSRRDVWRTDPRIAAEHQLGAAYYRANRFDRGHLTRREDLEYGPTRAAALAAAEDTCHWTNCTPQHERFNQNKQLWQGIERYLLEDHVERQGLRAQVITGPVLADDDPVWKRMPQVRYPVGFWKVVAVLDAAGRLFATAYLLDQREVIASFGIERRRGAPLGAFRTYQVPVAAIERLTGLRFRAGAWAHPVALSHFDPLGRAGAVPRRRTARGAALPPGFLPLDALPQIVTGR